ncbi:sugar O-acetyltransferase [Leuconostoc lactis]|uniref:sugar O-acetyltransferase n=1 Tax=Leuconostoc lactis TaxID=1246 RepID=UPI00101F8530|nr:sugar O-acetyltransferase [Leuconostoc lactis]MSB66751.1 sugar O-acetyltransferase [Leuconostoc lactis]RYS87947.1 sugar O-acetyltransferase [Leuconostoc lactis]
MTTEKERMLAGKLYHAEDSELKQLRSHVKILVDDYNDHIHTKPDHALALLPNIFGHIGDNAYIEKGLFLDYGVNTHIGQNFFANTGLVLLDVAPIAIGHNVLFGPNVSLLTAGHPLDFEIRNEGLEFGLPITIKDNVWLGGNVMINPGITIGENAVIGSGTVVTKDIPANSIVVGNPGRVIRQINQADRDIWQAKKAEYLNSKLGAV